MLLHEYRQMHAAKWNLGSVAVVRQSKLGAGPGNGNSMSNGMATTMTGATNPTSTIIAVAATALFRVWVTGVAAGLAILLVV